jgi:ribulose kinase
MSHTAYSTLLESAGSHGKVLSKLESLLSTIASAPDKIATLTSDLHIWPDFHGNRSPLANPTLKGMVSGLTLSTSPEDLAIVYLATIQALAYGSRHIKDVMEKSGHKFTELVLCGGLIKSKLFVQMHADILGLPVVIPACDEPVLLGAAMSAAAAALPDLTLIDVVAQMAGGCTKVLPKKEDKPYHDKKYKVFLQMVENQTQYRKIMAD